MLNNVTNVCQNKEEQVEVRKFSLLFLIVRGGASLSIMIQHIKKVAAATILTMICTLLVWNVNGARNFWEGASVTYLLWMAADWFKTLFKDFKGYFHNERIKNTGTAKMKNDCSDYGFHEKGSLEGLLIGLPIALLVGGMTQLFALIF